MINLASLILHKLTAEHVGMNPNPSLYLDQLIEESVQFLRDNEPSEGYFLAFSGGKDSVVMYDVAKRSGVGFDAHYNITSADPPELVRFIKDKYPTVAMDYPGTTMWKLIPKKLMPPTRIVRYCCSELKEGGGEARIVLIGTKITDSHQRRKHPRMSPCKRGGKILVKPLYFWNDDDIWEYIHREGIEYCRLYDEGFKRLGCIACPFAGPAAQRRELDRWPKYREMYLRAFGRMIEERKRRGKASTMTWDTPEDVMAWWLKEDTHETD